MAPGRGSSRSCAEAGSRVTAVEPNQAMREGAESDLGGEPGFRMVSGSAEVTGLPDQSVDHIVSAQAFHWFDRDAAQSEFRRILRPGGRVALIWNSRLTQGTPFLEAYEQLLLPMAPIIRKWIRRTFRVKRWSGRDMREAKFCNRQTFDYEGLCGRLHSSSYAPRRDIRTTIQ